MSSSVEQRDHDSVELCKLCLQRRAKYVCPRCGTPYCSVPCYKSEGHLDCSEAFYQEWVEGELRVNKVSSDGRKKMMEILNKFSHEDMNFDYEELDSDDDASLPDLSERLSGINIDDSEAVWEKLSETERAAFKDLLKNGNIAKLIPNWEPWWCHKVQERKVTFLNEDSGIQAELKEVHLKCPILYGNIKPLSEITKVKPSFSVLFDLMNILGGYSITVRYFNGSHFDFPDEAATIIYKISKSLSTSQKFTCVDMALDAVGLESVTLRGVEVTENEIQLMKSDVKSMMEGPCPSDSKYYMLAALSDMHKLFSCDGKKSKYKGKFINIFPDKSLDIAFLKKGDLKASLVRLKYFLSWVFEYGDC